MERDKLKLIVRNLEMLVDALKAEIYYESKSYKFDENQMPPSDYDEIFEDD